MNLKKLLFLLAIVLCFCTNAQLRFHHPENRSPAPLIESMGIRYLQFSPLAGDLSLYADQLLSDSNCSVDTIIQREKSTRFYLRAYHKEFNPFSIPLDSIRTIISEQHLSFNGADRFDTAFYLRTKGIAIGADQLPALKVCFDMITKKLEDGFTATYYNRTKKKKVLPGESMTYYFRDRARPLVNVTWRRRNKDTGVI